MSQRHPRNRLIINAVDVILLSDRDNNSRGHPFTCSGKLWISLFAAARILLCWPFLGRWKMAKTNLSSMSIDALLTLRENVEKALSGRAKELQDQLSRLGRASGFRNRGRGSSLKGQKVPIKYRDRSGNTWAGRGAQPVWLREKLKGGAKLEDFAVGKTVASRNASPRITRRRAKR